MPKITAKALKEKLIKAGYQYFGASDRNIYWLEDQTTELLNSITRRKIGAYRHIWVRDVWEIIDRNPEKWGVTGSIDVPKSIGKTLWILPPRQREPEDEAIYLGKSWHNRGTIHHIWD